MTGALVDDGVAHHAHEGACGGGEKHAHGGCVNKHVQAHDGHAHAHKHAHAHDGCAHKHAHSHAHEHDAHSHSHSHAHDGCAHKHVHAHDAHPHKHATGKDHAHSHGPKGCSHGCSHGDGLLAYLPHGHGLSSRIASDRHSLQLACCILLVSLTAQLLAAKIVQSSVLEAEAVHTLLDGLVILLSLLSISLAAWPASARYSYGFARAEVLSALVSVLALALMCGHLLVRGVRALPDAWRAASMGVGVSKGKAVMLAEGITLVNNVLIAGVLSRNAESLNVRALRAHVVGDSVGNVVVLLAGGAMWLHPRLAILDPVLTIVVVVAIVALNVGLARETFEVLMQAAPAGMEAPVLEKALKNIRGVKRVADCHVWTVTSGVVVASVKLVMDETVVDRSHFQSLQEQAESILRDAGADRVTVQVRHAEENVGVELTEVVVNRKKLEEVIVAGDDSEHFALLDLEEV